MGCKVGFWAKAYFTRKKYGVNIFERRFKMKRVVYEQAWRNEFARRLNSRMEYLEIDQTRLSQLSGISQSSIHKYANGRNTPRASVIPRLAKALALSVSDLIDF